MINVLVVTDMNDQFKALGMTTFTYYDEDDEILERVVCNGNGRLQGKLFKKYAEQFERGESGENGTTNCGTLGELYLSI